MGSGQPHSSDSRAEVRIRVAPQRLIPLLSWIVVCLSVAGFAVVVLRSLGYPTVLGLAKLFDLDQENNIPTWFSVVTLLLAAQTLFLIFVASRQNQDRDSRSWAAFAAMLALMSFDEGASIHEWVSRHLSVLLKSDSVTIYPWVLAGAAFVVFIAIAARGFILRLPEPVRRRIIVAAVVYFSGCLGMEAIQGRLAVVRPDLKFLGWSCQVVEETLEMTGTVLLLRALLAHLSTLTSVVKVELRDLHT